MPKKILIFSTAYFPLVGGAEVAVREITDRLDDFEFHMITPKLKIGLSCEEKIGNVFVHRVGFGIWLDKFFIDWMLWRAWRLERKFNFDIIWSIMASQASIAAAFLKMIYPNKKLILTLQEGDEEGHLKRYALGSDFLYKVFIRPWHILVFKKADFITAISSYLKKRAIEAGAKCPIEIVPNGVDTACFLQEYSEEELSALRKEIASSSHASIYKSNNKSTVSPALPAGSPRVGAVGDRIMITTSRLVKKNAVDDVIKSLKLLPENVKFIILGTGPDLEILQNLAKDEGVADRINFLGLIDYKEIPKYLKISDIFIRPSLSEGFGNSFVEAMASGLPVIATQEGGIADFLFDSGRNPDKEPTGWAVNPRDPKGIVEAVKKILNNPEQTAGTVANAKKLVLEKYDWDLIAKDMREKVFSKILQKQI